MLGTDPSGLVLLNEYYILERADIEVEAERYVNHGSIATSTNSDQTISLAKKWLRNCLESHIICKKNHAHGFLPTRLIDLGTKASFRPRLVISKTLPPDVHYMTLSYRWGKMGDSFQLETGNYQKLTCEIPQENLPKTIIDAMNFCHGVDVRYLWIDAVCIIQDSTSDWALQSAQMADVYKNAVCSISAAWAEDSTQGLYRTRDQRLLQPLPVKTTLQRGASDYNILIDDSWDCYVYNAPLFSRGWVLQEHLLSPRIFYFGRHELFWGCGTLRANESRPFEFLTRWVGAKQPKTLDAEKAVAQVFGFVNENGRSNSHLCKQFLPHPYSLWQVILEAYSQLDLTVSNDRLVAVSGLAREVHQLIPENTYVSGLWKNYLPYQLLWTPQYVGGAIRDDKICRPEDFVAPSWSWASLSKTELSEVIAHPAAVNHLINKVEPFEVDVLLQILDVHTTLLDKDPFGRVSEGALKARGRLIRTMLCVEIEWTMSNSTLVPVPKKSWMITGEGLSLCSLDVMSDVKPSNSETIEYIKKISVRESFRIDKEVEGRDKVFSVEYRWFDAYFVEVLRYSSSEADDEFQMEARGLILAPTGVRKGQYRRIGTFRTSAEVNEEFEDESDSDAYASSSHSSGSPPKYKPRLSTQIIVPEASEDSDLSSSSWETYESSVSQHSGLPKFSGNPLSRNFQTGSNSSHASHERQTFEDETYSEQHQVPSDNSPNSDKGSDSDSSIASYTRETRELQAQRRLRKFRKKKTADLRSMPWKAEDFLRPLIPPAPFDTDGTVDTITRLSPLRCRHRLVHDLRQPVSKYSRRYGPRRGLRRCIFEYAYGGMEIGDEKILSSEMYEEQNGVDEDGFRLYTFIII